MASSQQTADPFGIATVQANVTAIGAAYTVIESIEDLPKAFGEVKNGAQFVRSILETARPTLEDLKPAAYQIISPIVQKCLEDSTKVKKIFQKLADKCNQNPEEKSWDEVRIWYLEAIGNDKERRVESLTKRLLGNLRKACSHESMVAISLVTDVDEALKKLEAAGASLEDSDFNKGASIYNSQTVNSGGFAQQNTPAGGTNVVAASIAGLLQAVAATCKAIRTIKDLPKAFEHVDKHLPLVQRTLSDVQVRLKRRTFTESEQQSVEQILQDCFRSAQNLEQIFSALDRKCRQDNDLRNWDKLRGWYRTTLQGIQGHRVESLMTDILKHLKELSLYESFALATQEDVMEIKQALQEISQSEPFMKSPVLTHRGSIANEQFVNAGGYGQQNAPTGGSNVFNSGNNISGGNVYVGEASSMPSYRM
ncbi:hypothetical protein LQW54_001406 [Pestalotiopsis sp. IQ-011]